MTNMNYPGENGCEENNIHKGLRSYNLGIYMKNKQYSECLQEFIFYNCMWISINHLCFKMVLREIFTNLGFILSELPIL